MLRSRPTLPSAVRAAERWRPSPGDVAVAEPIDVPLDVDLNHRSLELTCPAAALLVVWLRVFATIGNTPRSSDALAYSA